jgi:hypothetical protein
MTEFLSLKLENALDLADADPEQAAVVLREAAGFLRKGEPLPYPLALFLAEAFEKAMRKAPSVRGSELLLNLKLKANNRRKVAVNFEHVGRDFEECRSKNMTVLKSSLAIAERYGISESSVIRSHKKYLRFRTAEIEKESVIHEEEQRQYSDASIPKPKSPTK